MTEALLRRARIPHAPDDAGGDAGGAPRGDNAPIFSVTEISSAVKKTVEGAFQRVRVRGEISRPSFPSSGHVYFRLKDENAVLDAVVWRGLKGKLSMLPEDGLEVIASGRLTTFAGKSNYQIVVESLEMAGEGALLKLLEERRKKLAAEGLFAEERKRPLPYLPEVVGVITSPTGSVIRDILHRLADRFPRRVLVWPVAVQGEQAAPQVVAAIEGFNALAKDGPVPRPDVLIVARGGGSLEDLWAFNEEAVVRAAAASAIPLISAVGHETDTTLIDFAADRRAPTPSAAAEIAVPVRSELVNLVVDYDRRLVGAAGRGLEQRRQQVEGLGRGLPDPQRLLEDKAQRLDDRGERLMLSMAGLLKARHQEVERLGWKIPEPKQQIDRKRDRLDDVVDRFGKAGTYRFQKSSNDFENLDAERRLNQGIDARWRDLDRQVAQLGQLLKSLSYAKTLERGFAVVHADGQVVTRAAQVEVGQALELEFADGRAPAVAGDDGPARPKPKSAPKPKAPKGDQGTLL